MRLGLQQSGQLVAVGGDDVGQPEHGSVDADRRRRVQNGRRARCMATHQGFTHDVQRNLVADEQYVAGERAEPGQAVADVTRFDRAVSSGHDRDFILAGGIDQDQRQSGRLSR